MRERFVPAHPPGISKLVVKNQKRFSRPALHDRKPLSRNADSLLSRLNHNVSPLARPTNLQPDIECKVALPDRIPQSALSVQTPRSLCTTDTCDFRLYN